MLRTKLCMLQSLYKLFCYKVDGYIRKYDDTKYLALIYCDEIYGRISYLVLIKRNVFYIFILKNMRKTKLIQMMIYL